MSNQEPTPGPYTAEWIEERKRGKTIGHWFIWGKGLVAYIENNPAYGNAKANACLLAASWELLQACEKALAFWQRYIDRTGAHEPWALAVRDSLMDAVSKARGRQ